MLAMKTLIRLLSALGLAALFGLSTTSNAQGNPVPAPTPQQALVRLYQNQSISTDWWAASFLKAVPIAAIKGFMAQIRAESGQFLRVEPVNATIGNFRVVFERASILNSIQLNNQGQIEVLTLAPALFFKSPITPAAALERLAKASKLETSWFDPNFLRAVPLAQIEGFWKTWKNWGGFTGINTISADGGVYKLLFVNGFLPATVGLNSSGQINSFLLEDFVIKAKNIEEVKTNLRALPGQVSLLVLANGRELVALNPDQPLAVGSAFKMAILRELVAQIQSGVRNWSDTVTLTADVRVPSSMALAQKLDQSQLTLTELAAAMISVSDNTATDLLLAVVGREAVAAQAPERNRPFLSTRDLFILKSKGNEDLLKRWQTQLGERQAVLEATKTRKIGAFSEQPTALDAEWLYSARELCALIEQVAPQAAMQLNAGVANTSDWATVAFKGGSEPGVINLSTWLVGKNGQQYCVVATWNDPKKPVDGELFAANMSGLMDLLDK
jgi:beta-lactamase class A